MSHARIRSAMVTFLLLSGLALLGTTPSTATESPAASDSHVTATCYDGGKTIIIPAHGYSKTYTTSSRCKDLSLKNITGKPARICAYLYKTGKCGPPILIPSDGKWHVILSDIKDGTKFKLYNYQAYPLKLQLAS